MSKNVNTEVQTLCAFSMRVCPVHSNAGVTLPPLGFPLSYSVTSEPKLVI